MAKEQGRKPERDPDSFDFSPAARRYLREAKWIPGRRVPTAPYKSAYEGEGLVLLPAPERFLQQFGGLIIRYELRPGQKDVLDFRADDAVRGLGPSMFLQLSRLVEVPHLCPVGHYQYGTCMLLQDDQGRVFGVSDDTTTYIGESGEQAIENILSGQMAQIIRSEVVQD